MTLLNSMVQVNQIMCALWGEADQDADCQDYKNVCSLFLLFGECTLM